MSVLDIILLILVSLGLILGILTGFSRKLSSFLSTICGLIVSYFIATPLNNFLVEKNFYSFIDKDKSYFALVTLIITWILIFIIVYIFVKLLVNLFKKIAYKSKIFAIIDRLLGGVLGLANGLFITCIILLILGFTSNYVDSLNSWLTYQLNMSSTIIKKLFEFCATTISELPINFQI